jgi:hypothetical protein
MFLVFINYIFGVNMNYLKIVLALFFVPYVIFAQIEAPSSLLPANGSIEESIFPVLSWEHPSNAASFTIQISKSSSFNDMIVEEQDITDKFYIPDNSLDRSDKYYFRVMAETDEEQSDWSSTNVFFTYNDVGFLSQINNEGYVFPTSIRTDAEGNIYLTGSFEETADFGNDISLTSNGYSDIFVAKYNPAGQCLWAVSFGGSRNDQGQGIALDNDGNIYIVGTFYTNVLFGSTELISNGFNDVFLAKLDENGNAIWAKQGGGGFFDKGNALSLDSEGSIYITGEFSSVASFENNDITSNGSTDAFLAKYNNSGALQWIIGFGGTAADYGYGIGLDSNEEPVVTGVFSNEVEFSGDIILTSVFNVDRNRYSIDIFLSQFDQMGDCQWAASAGGEGSDYSYSLFIDDNDDIFTTGKFENTADFGELQISSQGATDIFVAEFNTTDDWIYAVSAGSTENDLAWDITAGDDYLYLAGYFKTSADFGECTLTSKGDYDAFFAKLDKISGDFINVLSGGGEEFDAANAITTNVSGDIYACGQYTGDAVFGQFNPSFSEDKNTFIINPFSESDFQSISINKGWNLISTYMNPKNRLIANIFSRNYDDILLVKNSAGDLYFPSLGLNTIEQWQQDEAYQVYSFNKFNLIIDGNQIVPSDVTLTLSQGWSFIPFLPDTQMSIVDVFSDIEDSFLLVKDINGKLYFPELNINNIVNMLPGSGYKIYMLEGAELTYPNE